MSRLKKLLMILQLIRESLELVDTVVPKNHVIEESKREIHGLFTPSGVEFADQQDYEIIREFLQRALRTDYSESSDNA